MASTACSLYITIFLKSKFKSGSSNSNHSLLNTIVTLFNSCLIFHVLKNKQRTTTTKTFSFILLFRKFNYSPFQSQVPQKNELWFLPPFMHQTTVAKSGKQAGKSLGLLLRKPPMTTSIRHSQWTSFIPHLWLHCSIWDLVVCFIVKSSSFLASPPPSLVFSQSQTPSLYAYFVQDLSTALLCSFL